MSFEIDHPRPLIHNFCVSVTVSYTVARQSEGITAMELSFSAYIGLEPGLWCRMKNSWND
jgi:hypothetical protein